MEIGLGVVSFTGIVLALGLFVLAARKLFVPSGECEIDINNRVTITTTDGKQFSEARDVPKGDPRDPMTDDDLRVKFDALAEPVMTDRRRRRQK